MRLLLLFIASFFLFAGIAVPVSAATDFNLLSPIQGVNPTGDLSTYLSAIFRIAIGVAAFLAIIMIAIGGFEYMGSDVVFSKENGKSRITSALFGLLLILFSVILLYTINPQILSLTINGNNLGPVPNSSSSGTGETTNQPIQIDPATGRPFSTASTQTQLDPNLINTVAPGGIIDTWNPQTGKTLSGFTARCVQSGGSLKQDPDYSGGWVCTK